MKKIILLIVPITAILLLIFICLNNKEYTIKVNIIDLYSPDRILEVYKGDKKTGFKEIKYKNNITLCYESNPTVAYIDLIGEEELIVILENDKKVKAKIKED